MMLPLNLRSTFPTTCIVCGTRIIAERTSRKTCSNKCRQQHHRDKRAGRNGNEHTVTRTVHGTNAELLAAAAKLYIPDAALVVDVTFGRGTFWQLLPKSTRPFRLISSDLATRADIRADSRALPFADESIDVLVLDPPYVRSFHPRMMFHNRYNGLGSVETFNNRYSAYTPLMSVDDVRRLYEDGMTEARRVLKSRGRMMVKTMDQVECREQQWVHVELHAIAQRLGMFGRDLFVLVPTAPPSFKRWKKQIHARKSHSFLWVFERSNNCFHVSGASREEGRARGPATTEERS